jgi:hypothetical protein
VVKTATSPFSTTQQFLVVEKATNTSTNIGRSVLFASFSVSQQSHKQRNEETDKAIICFDLSEICVNVFN